MKVTKQIKAQYAAELRSCGWFSDNHPQESIIRLFFNDGKFIMYFLVSHDEYHHYKATLQKLEDHNDLEDAYLEGNPEFRELFTSLMHSGLLKNQPMAA